MNVFVTGGSGFVGTYLCRFLLDRGHRVTAVGGRAVHGRIRQEGFDYISADTTMPGPWQERLKDAEAVVNLAGRSIFTRWTPKTKGQIYDSRVLTTRNLVDALSGAAVLCSTSAVGVYGSRGEEVLTEESAPGDDFLARVGVDWEAEAFRAEKKGARVAAARFGVVLGRGGGAMEKMVPAFKFMLGGPMGDGAQWFPWIHMEDLLSAVLFVLENETVSGAINFTAPNPVRNREMAGVLGEVLNRPALMPAPAFLVRLVLGEFAETLLGSQRAVPKRLLDAGFRFRFSEIREALLDLV